MNMHTFKDAVASRRQTLADQFIEDDDDDDDEAEKCYAGNREAPKNSKRSIEGEEDGDDSFGGKFNDGGDMITPFNMKDERESGFIDSDMNFVFKKEQQEVDAWVANLNDANSETIINNAAIAEKKRLARIAEQEKNSSDLDRKSPMDLKLSLLALMQPGETVSRTLRRLSGKDDAHQEGTTVRRRRPQQQDDTSSAVKTSTVDQQKATAKKNRLLIESVTELADRLISQGMTDIYTTTYEALSASTIRWEYQAVDGRIYGPFTTQQIVQWRQQGFLTGDTSVMMRKVAKRMPRSQPVDSIYDDEDDAETLRKRMRDNSGAAVASSSGAAVEENPWEHSDSIDFDSFLSLESQVKMSNDNHTLRNDYLDDTSARRATAVGTKKTLRFAVSEEDDMDYDEDRNEEGGSGEEDDDDDEAEGFRRKKRRKGITFE